MALFVGAWRPWLFFVVAFVVTVVPLGLSRVTMFGPTLGRDPVYQLIPAYLFLFSFAVAVTGERRGARAGQPRGAMPMRRGVMVALTVVAVVVFLGAYWRGADETEVSWQATPTHDYFSNLRSDVAALSSRGVHPGIFNPVVPPSIVPLWLAPYNALAVNLLVPDVSTTSADPSYVIAPDGHLVHVGVEEIAGGAVTDASAAKIGWVPTRPSCWAPGTGAVPLGVTPAGPTEGHRFAVRLAGNFAADADINVTVDGVRLPVMITPHVATAYFEGPPSQGVSIAMSPTAGCVSAVSLARLTPIPTE
jgi:hypothetical protein